MFSIIIPAYNAEKCINRCIQSIMNQTFQDYEVIVINDGSTDCTEAVVKKLCGPKIHLFNQKNGGVSVARNNGIKHATKNYICFLDSDDEWKGNHLQLLYEAIHMFPEKKFFVTLSETELLDGTIVRQKSLEGYNKPFFVKDFLEFEIRNGYQKCFNTNCVCTKTDVFTKYGYFEEGEKISEDVDMWNRIMLYEGKVIIPTETVLRHRDYSFATRKMPVGAPFIFNRRIPGYLSDPTISNNMKEELNYLYNVMELTSIRSLIINGLKKEAFKRMKYVEVKYVSKKKYIETIISYFVPSALMRKWIAKESKNYFR